MSKTESANLILKLYELRRDPTMREARNWMITFFPESAEDVMKTMLDERTSAYFRMVTSYWDMAASFVNHGAIDEEMFNDAHGEHIMAFSRIEPFLEEFRQTVGNPTYLSNLEKLIVKSPEDRETLKQSREKMKQWVDARNKMSKSA